MHQSPDILASFGDWETRMERALASVRAGRGVLVVDDEDRENEGDLIYPAHSLTDAQMARLIRHCSGIVCLCLTDERATRHGGGWARGSRSGSRAPGRTASFTPRATR